jgi:hypothetical protein
MSQGFAPPPSGAPQFQAPTPPRPYPPYPGVAPAAHPLAPSAGAAPQQAPVPLTGGPPQRPAVIALGGSLAVVASLQWICVLSLFWVAATVGTSAFAEIGDNGAVFHILNRFNYRMLDGLAVPLYLFPLASFVTGFLVLGRRRWARTLHTALGLAALAWAAWWLQGALLWWFGAAWYVVVACLVLWTPAATAWYRWPEGGDGDRPLA